LLRTLWAHVRDDGVVLVGETPNRVASFDSHTTNLQFVDILTNELYLDYTSHFSPRTDYRDFMSRFDDKLMGSYRAGRGVSFHEFDLMFGTQGAITPHIFSDSFNALLRNAYPISKAELSFLDMFRWHQFPVDQVFSRYWIEMFLKKSANGASANARSFAIQNPTHGENQVIGCDIYGLPAFGLPGPSSFLTFDVPNSTTGIQFMFDVGESTGAVEVFDQSARVFEIFEIEDLRSRVPEFQRYVAVDRPLSPGCEQLTIRPLGAASRVISGGLGLFGAPPLGPLDPRNPRILSAATF
jgi:hypothetical protein